MKKKRISILIRVIIYLSFVGVIMVICYLISRYFNYNYMRTIEYAGALFIIIGGFSLAGNIKIRSDVRNNLTKLTPKFSRGLDGYPPDT